MRDDNGTKQGWATTGLLLITVLAGMLVSHGLRSAMSNFGASPDRATEIASGR